MTKEFLTEYSVNGERKSFVPGQLWKICLLDVCPRANMQWHISEVIFVFVNGGFQILNPDLTDTGTLITLGIQPALSEKKIFHD